MNAQSIVSQFVTRNDNGEIIAMDFAGLDSLTSELVTLRAQLRGENKELVKASKEASNAQQNEVGKTYFDSLKIGDHFSYTDSKGTVIELVKIETKSKSGATAAGEMVNPPAGAKSTKRYPKFYQLNVA